MGRKRQRFWLTLLFLSFVGLGFLSVSVAEIYAYEIETTFDARNSRDLREKWLRANAFSCSPHTEPNLEAVRCSIPLSRDQWVYVFDPATRYMGVVYCNAGVCACPMNPSCALGLQDAFLVPAFTFSGEYAEPAVMEPSQNSGPAVVRPYVYSLPIIFSPILHDPLVWFLKFECVRSGSDVNCDAARSFDKRKVMNVFRLESDDSGRIVMVEEYTWGGLFSRQRYFYTSSVALLKQFEEEYENAKGKFSLVYVSDPLGVDYHVIFGF